MVLTKGVLEQHLLDKKALDALDRKLDEYSKRNIKAEHGVVMSSMKNFPYAPCHVVVSGSNIKDDTEYKTKVRQLFVTYLDKKKKYESDETEIVTELEKMTDVRLRTILALKYIDNLNDRQIAEQLGVSRSLVTKCLVNFQDTT